MKSSEDSKTVLTTTKIDHSNLLQKNINMKNKRNIELKSRIINLKKIIREYELEMLEIKDFVRDNCEHEWKYEGRASCYDKVSYHCSKCGLTKY